MAYTKIGLVRGIAANLAKNAPSSNFAARVAGAARLLTNFDLVDLLSHSGFTSAHWDALCDGSATDGMDPTGYGGSIWGDAMDAASDVENYLAA